MSPRRAAANGVDLLALSDHDARRLLAARSAAAAVGMGFVNGVEISIEWQALQIHILGYAFDSSHQALNAGLESIRAGAMDRAQRMSAELEKIGIAGAFDGAMRYAANPNLISRAHFGRFLVETGVGKDLRSVFESYLVPGRPGYVDHRWATLADSVAWIHAAPAGGGGGASGALQAFACRNAALSRRVQGSRRAGDRSRVGQPHAGACRLFGRYAWRRSMAFWPRAARISTDRARAISISGNWRLAGWPETRLGSFLSRGEAMAQYVSIHPDNPQQRLLQRAAEVIARAGSSPCRPTPATPSVANSATRRRSSGFAASVVSMSAIMLTLMCRDLSQIGQFARVDNATYRLLKATTPGSYTFILEGTRELPRRVLHPKRKTIGLRVPAHARSPWPCSKRSASRC
jgi:hypothetical protein